MKLITTNEKKQASATTFQCRGQVAGCQKVLSQIATTRAAILAESQQTLVAPERLLRLAVNEAEALAWQTAFPHLFFPLLAMEKVQGIATWSATQESVRRDSPMFALAA